MIFDIIFFVIGVFVGIIGQLLSAIGSALVFPIWISDGLSQFFGRVAVFHGILPLVATPGASGLAGKIGMIDLFGWGLGFLAVMMAVKVIHYFTGWIPFLNIRPSHKDSSQK